MRKAEAVTMAARATTLDLAALEAAAAGVPDPELPVVTIGELGIVRGVSVADDGVIEVRLTPTYVGCPATEAIAADVRAA
ncbi:MAG: metal-sulfur cluster assembly factor, partial [Catenulispora sp.]